MMALSMLGMVILCMLPGKKVLAYTPKVEVGSADLVTNPYTEDGLSAGSDPGEGSRADGYALFDAGSNTLTLHDFNYIGATGAT